jgi:putative endonuclease
MTREWPLSINVSARHVQVPAPGAGDVQVPALGGRTSYQIRRTPSRRPQHRRLSTPRPSGPWSHLRVGAIVSRMTQERLAVGAYGERLAAAHLLAQGMVLLDRNWRCTAGEIDIIARDGSAVVFVEVKTRRGDGFGLPAESVVADKVRRLRRLAAEWLARSGVRPTEVRFDVVSVLQRPKGSARIEHLKGAF